MALIGFLAVLGACEIADISISIQRGLFYGYKILITSTSKSLKTHVIKRRDDMLPDINWNIFRGQGLADNAIVSHS